MKDFAMESTMLKYALAALMLCGVSLPAAAQELAWPHSEWAKPAHRERAASRHDRRAEYRAPKKTKRKQARVADYRVTIQYDETLHLARGDGSRCLAPLRVFGPRSLPLIGTQSGAREKAWDIWESAVEWRYGTRYVDRINAEDVWIKCGKASAADNEQDRCELIARPCQAEFTRGETQ